MQNRAPLLFVCIVAFGVMSLWTTALTLLGEDVKEKFANISEGALLTTLPKWTHASGTTNNWVLASFGDSEGGGFEATGLGAYRRALSDSEALTMGSRPYSLKAKIRFTGSTAYASVHVDLLKSGGIDGCGIRFDGGTSDGASANSISVSSGGTYWGDVKYHVIENSHWQTNVWYQIEINNIVLGASGLTGTVSIYDKSNPTTKLVDNYAIGLYGVAGGLDRFDQISISSVGAERPFQMGDIELVRTETHPSSN
jgi:hypothetical protein